MSIRLLFIVQFQDREKVKWLSGQLKKNGIQPLCVTGEMTPLKRFRNFALFRKGTCQMLIATDVANRGVDIDSVNIVINYDLPIDNFGRANWKNYLHRVGRCDRFGNF